MAKLNGVKTVAETIEYNGVQYEKIDVTPKAGDILRVDDSDYDYVTEGAYYEVDHVDSSDDPQIIDNDGDSFDCCRIDYTLFRKVDVPQTKQYREVIRKANVGEKAKVVGGYSHSFERGDIVIALDYPTAVTNGVRFRRDDGIVQTLVHTHGDYVVLEPIAEQSDDIFEVDGVKYRKLPKSELKIGGYIVSTFTGRDITRGRVYEVIGLTGRENPRFKDNVNDSNYLDKEDYEVVERLATTSDDLQRQVSELQTKLAEAESKLATQKAEEEKAKDPRSAFAKGDKVRLINGGGVVPLYGYEDGEVYTVSDPRYLIGNKIEIIGGQSRTGYALPSQLTKLSEQEIAEMDRLKVGEYAKVVSDKNRDGSQRRDDVILGDIVEIIEYDESVVPFRAKIIRNDDIAWFRKEALIRATDEEVAKAKAKAHKASFKVGDYARVVNDNYEHRVGHIVKVSGLEDEGSCFDYKIERLTLGNHGYIKAENIEKINAEEAEEIVNWAKIGRAVGEFKAGDVIEIVRYQNGLSEGTVSTITRVHRKSVTYKSGYLADKNCIKLIAPVESVVNLATAN
ncbi:hypothetical protein [Paenibacillus alvei]|uniref:hypothetical protein n=1 Tax=Paenibacillus alvei TaxID=44250 RepID=UPI0018CE6FC8|nr:hypothetical protein [Paenibacillus alvei]MBG9736464.1 hypothetical protein [Paenibacillus alvei]MBG9736494.1 hypothetical protein [Paenibacillus alvei]MBG9736506.1 hypothetical protein [Paenibacillus alvei]MBG9736605.1 hypothetical protein [Paenibacillus alvei]MBG9745589.1 hypothetical protein [Paenibacillus alvei]